ncbi:MAG: DUF2946 family protein [Pseudomonadota bacterium]|jgi:hypothetical protein|nr:DUF2946 family protein [Pseudomonadota bacterium]
MTSFWHRWYRPLTALALFAMLLAFTGPLISQMQRLMEMPIGTMAEMPRHGDAESHAHGQPRAVDEVHLLHHFDMAACGYCELFLHAPGLALPRVLPPSMPPPATFHPPAVAVLPSTTPVYPRYASRAPPRA